MLRRTRMLKIVLFSLCLMTVLVIMVVNTHPRTGEKSMKRELKISEKIVEPKSEQLRLFHLDLKGAPPKMTYLLKILPLARKAGANGLLIEYEDMFPWSGRLKNLSAGNAYSVDEVKNLLNLVKELKMEIIPLVQTFGHLEFMLKQEEFRHLRELDPFPQEICPSKKEALRVVKEMIRQIMAQHESAKFLHIGCDEVYHLAACSTCSLRNPRTIFIDHVKHIAEFVRENYPGVIPIIWDDMMRHWAPMDIEDSGLGKIVEPMVWVYIDDIPRLVPHFIWYVYKKTFPRIWAASAFKGAYGETELLPDLPRHMENQLAWLRRMKPDPEEDVLLKEGEFRGIALTGWSRYDHFAVLAELLPVSIPSLIFNLALVEVFLNAPVGTTVEAKAFEKALTVLDCPKSLPYRSIEELRKDQYQWLLGTCSYPGNNMHYLIQGYFSIQTRLNIALSKKNTNGWVSDYNIKHNYTSPYRLLEVFPDEGFAAQGIKKSVVQLKHDLSEVMKEYYDTYTIEEWLEQKLGPIESALKDLEKTFQFLIEFKTWPRRPFK